MYNSTFDTVYHSTLKDALGKLKGRRTMASIAGVLTRIFSLYFVTVVISLFIGFMQMFPFGDFPGGFAGFIQYFMYIVLSIVILGIINKQIKVYLGERFPNLLKNNMLVMLLTLIIGGAVFVAGYFIGTRFLGSEFNGNFMVKWAGAIGSVFLAIGPYMLIKKIESKFNSDYQSVVFTASAKAIATDCMLKENEYLPQTDFEQSKLFTYQEIWSYEGSMLFTRSAENFMGSKLAVKQREVKSSNGKTESSITDLFTGFLLITDFNKAFNGETYIVPDTARQTMGEIYGEYLNSVFHRKETKLVALENTEFEKAFAVYSTDGQEARYILSTKLMERIMEFKQTFYQDILISFVGNKIYVAIKNDTDMFAPHLFGALDDSVYLEKQFNYIKAMLILPDTLDLKTKVWN